MNKILQKNQLISCSDDKTIKLWEIIEEQTNYLNLKQIFKGHTDWILQVISIPNDKIISCSYDGSIRIWSCLSFQEQTTFYQKQYKPWGILYLSKNNKFVFSYTYEYNGFIMIYESNTPHQFIKVIDGVYGWWYGMIELNDGNIAVSQEKPNRICIIDSIKYEIVYDLRNEEFIKSIGALEKLNCYSFLFIWKGEILQIGTINGKEYEIQYINKDEKDVNGVSGIVIEEEEKYLITCNRNGNHGLNIYKFEV